MNLQEIKNLEPCIHRWENLIKHYPNWSGSLLEFMELKLISDKDKVWLFNHTKSVNDSIKKEFAFICAEIAMQYTDKEAIHEFHILNLLDYISNSFDCAANYAANSAAYCVANYAANYAAYSAADHAAYYAADSTADSEARRNQVDIIKNLLEGDE